MREKKTRFEPAQPMSVNMLHACLHCMNLDFFLERSTEENCDIVKDMCVSSLIIKAIENFYEFSLP